MQNTYCVPDLQKVIHARQLPLGLAFLFIGAINIKKASQKTLSVSGIHLNFAFESDKDE
jgi:hypothetical protein